jgi:hypothetical protein
MHDGEDEEINPFYNKYKSFLPSSSLCSNFNFILLFLSLLLLPSSSIPSLTLSLLFADNDKAIRVNESYRPLSIEKLSKLDYWQHIKPEILEQGRVCFFDGRLLAKFHSDSNEEDDDDDDEDDEESQPDAAHNKPCTEMPAPLFASCSGDRLTNDATISPWTIRLSDVVDSLSPPLVLLQSNIWPGAFAFVKDG